jgi:hypothetical protein
MTEPIEPSNDNRDDMLDHMGYERDMMIDTFGIRFTSRNLTTCEQNALEESCMVHARAIRFFLVSKPNRTKEKQKYDAWAGDYFVDPQDWLAFIEQKPTLLCQLDQVSGKFLAHPSYCRTLDSKRSDAWLEAVVTEVIAQLTRFQESANKPANWSRFVSRAQFTWPIDRYDAAPAMRSADPT